MSGIENILQFWNFVNLEIYFAPNETKQLYRRISYHPVSPDSLFQGVGYSAYTTPGNMAEMFRSNIPENPQSRAVVVKTKRIHRDKKSVFFYFVCLLPLSVLCGCIALLHINLLYFYLIFSHPRGLL